MKLSSARKENSPPLQRWVSVQETNQVPSGTKDLPSLAGLAWIGWAAHPAINGWAIFKKSPRECRIRSDCTAKNAEKEFLFVVRELLMRIAEIIQKLKIEIGKAEMDRIWRRSQTTATFLLSAFCFLLSGFLLGILY